MKRMITSFLLIVSLLAVTVSAFAESLDTKTQEALIEALQDEYKARALYQKVMEKFGEIRPFSNIIKAEEQHIAELKPLFQKYGLDIPEDEWYEKVSEFATVQEACEAGVKAEIENADMYDEFFSFVKEQDIIDAFTRLRDASQDKHLPAFQRCANTGDTGKGQGGTGRGQGRAR